MTTTIAEETKTDQLRKDSDRLIEEARSIQIVDDTTFQNAGEFLRNCKTFLKRVAETFDPLIKSQNEAVKQTRETKARFCGPAENAELIVKGKLSDYQRQQEEKRRAEEALAREKAAKEAEEKRLAEAIALEAAGDSRAAEAVIDAPVFVPPPVITTTAPKVKGVAFKSQWKFRVDNANAVPREFLKVDEVLLGQHVRAHKAAAVGTIPGVTVWEETGVSASGF